MEPIALTTDPGEGASMKNQTNPMQRPNCQPPALNRCRKCGATRRDAECTAARPVAVHPRASETGPTRAGDSQKRRWPSDENSLAGLPPPAPCSTISIEQLICRTVVPRDATRTSTKHGDEFKLLISLDVFGGRSRARTYDPLIKSQLLYQLSYAPSRHQSGGPTVGDAYLSVAYLSGTRSAAFTHCR